ncbi:MAG: MFS transporter [Dehalococcoidia bacterium]|nr:MFS transporter [Dehalococcoidia bacterium]
MTTTNAEPAGTAAAPAPEHPVTPFRWAIIGQLWLHQVLALCAVSGLGVLLVGMERDLNFGTIEAGWLGSARTTGQFLVFPLSFLAVRFAPKHLCTWLLFGMALAIIWSGFAPNFWLLLGSQVAFSLGLALSQVPATILRLQWVPPSEMARVWGVGNALSAMSQSATLAVVPLAVVLLGGWRPIFQLAGALLLASSFVWLFTARENTLRGALPGPRKAAGWGALRRREFYLLGVTMLGGGTAYTTAILFLPLYFVHDRGFSLATAGSITAVLPAAGLLSNLSAGFLSDRIGRRKIFIWPVGIVLPMLYWIALSPLSVPAEVLVVFALGYFAWFPFPVLMAIPYEIRNIEPADVAVGQALIQAVAGSGFIAAPIIASYVAHATGSYGTGILSLSLLPVLFSIGWVLLPETGPAARRARPVAAA